jgi:hypothetical protein
MGWKGLLTGFGTADPSGLMPTIPGILGFRNHHDAMPPPPAPAPVLSSKANASDTDPRVAAAAAASGSSGGKDNLLGQISEEIA